MRSTKNSGRRFRRSLRAISPVIAVLLMIVIAVAASLVAYAWVMGYLGFTTSKVGKAIQIQSISRTGDPDYEVTAYVQNVGDSEIELSDAYVNGMLVPTAIPDPIPLGQGETETILLGGPYPGAQVTVKVVASDGTFIEYTKTFTSSNGGDGGDGGTTYTLTIGSLVGGTGTGSVDLDPAGGSYDADTVVTVTATADGDSEFVAWGGDLSSSGSTNPTTINMDGDKTITATFDLIPAEETTLRPTGSGSFTNLDNDPWYNSNWECVDETSGSGDGDSSNVYRGTSSGYPSFTIDTYATADSSDLGTINSVTVWIRARHDLGYGDTSTGYAETVLRIGSTNYYGSTETLTTSYNTYSTTYDENPAGGSWTWTAVNSLQCGVGLTRTSGGGDARCTQVWVVVNYTP